MAQAKPKSSAKRSRGPKKSQARSRGSSSKASKSKSTSSSSSKSRRSPKPASSPSSRKPAPVAAVGNAADKATNAVGNATGKATTAVGHAAGKAKIPLLAGGAALAGTAGGMVLGVRQARRHRPRSRTLAKAAKGAGNLGAQVGHLAYELQRNREAIDGNGSKQHRSPVEVVLQGLTARRSRT
jgi:hypothetical protein